MKRYQNMYYCKIYIIIFVIFSLIFIQILQVQIFISEITLEILEICLKCAILKRMKQYPTYPSVCKGEQMRRKYPFSFSEIAEEAGVSTATVSRVLNGQSNVKADLIEKVYNVLETRGLNPNEYIVQAPSSGRLLLFVLPFEFNSFFNEIIKGAKASALQHGYTMMILQ